MFILAKISLVSVFVMIASVILRILGILDDQYLNIIINVNLIIQIISLGIFIILVIYFRNWPKGIKILRHQFENKLIKGDTDIFIKPIFSTNPRKFSIFKIYFEIGQFAELPEFGISKTKICGKSADNKEIKKHLLNINSGIMEDIFIFSADMIVMPNEKVNFKFKNDVNIKTFFLVELYIP